MLKFIRGKGQQPSAERLRLQKELYAFQKTVTHGFPHKPSALAYDAILSVLAIGTQTGAIKVFGRPGVEFYGQQAYTGNDITDQNIQLLEWVYGTGRLISLTTGNQLTLWEPDNLTLIPIKTLEVDGKLKKIACICSASNQDVFWLGTEAGSVYQVQLQAFEIGEPLLTHEQFLPQIPPTYKVNPGAVECIRQLPHLQDQLLIAFNRGLCVLWNTETSSVVRSFVVSGHGQSVGVHVSITGADFTWYHADGSYATWKTDSIELPKDVSYVPYGPDPCKSINRLYKGKRDKFDMVVFSGGMPRSAYGEHHCVSVHCTDGSKICLDFTSKVIDFVVTFRENSEYMQVLIVLLEEELCAYDLTDVAVPAIKMPYLHSLHASAITCNHIASQVPKDVYDKIVKAGAEQNAVQSDMEWPITGGEIADTNEDEEEHDEENVKYDILLTGHEDGSVKFWDCTDLNLIPICVFKTARIFRNENDGEYASDGENWSDSEPPFRKAGHFDPYSDDPRLAIKKIVLCKKTGHCLIGGTAGQLILTNFDSGEDNSKKTFHFMTMNLVNDRDGFLWKGHDQLTVKQSLLEEQEFLENTSCANVVVVQVLPPAGITSLALETDWSIISAGTAHGLVAYDFKNLKPIFHRCTLNPNDINGAGEQLSRRKSFKKSLRESFRKLRKGRSTRRNNAEPQTTLAARPVERQIEARSPNDDGMGSMVRFLLFAKTYVANGHTLSPTLWSATNSGTVSVFLLHLERAGGNIAAQLAKEIQLKHRAPVVGITVFDQNAAAVGANNPGPSPHRVLIASEEQFKIFSLPQLKPMNKYKLTAHEGTRIRRIQVNTFSCKLPADILDVSADGTPKHTRSTESTGEEDSNKIYTETALLSLTNMGEVMVLSIPELRRQFYASVIRREDINGISSLCFTNNGEALYFISSSELQRVSFCTQKLCLPKGRIPVAALVNKKDEDENSEINFALKTPTGTPVPQKRHSQLKPQETEVLENGFNGVANETQFSNSLGDITMDSVRDHLNTTTSTLCSTVTDESVGRLSINSTQKHLEETTINTKNFLRGTNNSNHTNDKNNTTVSSDSSVTIKATITSIAQNERDPENVNDAAPKLATCRESRL